MIDKFQRMLGMNGVPPGDRKVAYIWERRLHWLMVGIALLSIPALFIEIAAHDTPLLRFAGVLDLIILFAFTAELLWMLYLCRQKVLYLLNNWLSLLIIGASMLALLGLSAEWTSLLRLLRITYVLLVLGHLFTSMRRNPVPYALSLGILTLTIAGAGFYWLEPTIHTFGEGLWLAFVTGATVGYGDVVPTTAVSRTFAVIMVLVGFTIFSVLTASVAAFFVGEEEKSMNRKLHQDVCALRDEIAALRAVLAKCTPGENESLRTDRDVQR